MTTANNRYSNLEGGVPTNRALATARGAALAGTAIGLDGSGNFPVATVAPGALTAGLLATGAAATNLGVAGTTSSLIAGGTHLLSVPNGNFEDGLAGWASLLTGSGSAAQVNTSYTATGQNSALIFAPNSGCEAKIVSALIPCTAGGSYNVLARAMTNGGSASLRVTITFYDKTKAYQGTSLFTDYTNANGLNVNGFTEVGYSFAAPAGACYYTVAVAAEATSSSTTGGFYVDEVRVNRAIGPTDTATGLTMTTPAALATTTQAKDFAPVNLSMLNESIQGSTGIFGVAVQHIEHSYSGGKGARCSLYVNTTLNGPSAAGSDNCDYVAGYFRASANSADRGTSSAPNGALFGSNPVAALGSNATNFVDCTGEEIDVGMYSGSSSVFRSALRCASYGTAKASSIDTAIIVTTLADTGFDYGITFLGTTGTAPPVTKTFIYGAANAAGGNSPQAAIDFTSCQFQGISGGWMVRWNNVSGVLTDGSLSAPRGVITQCVSAYSTIVAQQPVLQFQANTNSTDKKNWQHTVDSSGNYFLQTVNDAQNAAYTALSISRGTGNNFTSINVGTTFMPGSDGAFALGGPSNRWTAVYAANGAIQTSDENEKTDVAALPEALLDAIADLPIRQFRFKDAVAAKGDKARTHIGVLAQDVERVCKAHGVNGEAYGFFCRDPLFEDVEEDEVIDAPVMRDEEYEAEDVEVADGAARRVRVTRTRSVPVVDRVPIIGHDGEPEMTPGFPRTPKIVPVEVPVWVLTDGDGGPLQTVAADECPPGGRPMLAEGGAQVTQMVKRQAVDDKGLPVFNPAVEPQPVYHEVPRVERKTVKRTVTRPKLDDEGEPVYLHGVRYDQIAMAMVAALRRRKTS